MNSMSTLLLETLPQDADDEARQFATRIQNGAYRMNQLLDDLLAYSAFYKLDTPLEPISPQPIVEEIISELDTDLKRRDAKVTIRGPLPQATANSTLLKMVLSNLIFNAVKYVPENRTPQVEISAQQSDGHVEISVVDNGPGIPPQFREKIFQPFERLHRDQSGTGLGLAIVMRGVQKMRGEAGVDPNPSGTGSRFWVRLPKA
jgi:signal transduction histidine kinase